jgi:hypothetical protein
MAFYKLAESNVEEVVSFRLILLVIFEHWHHKKITSDFGVK